MSVSRRPLKPSGRRPPRFVPGSVSLQQKQIRVLPKSFSSETFLGTLFERIEESCLFSLILCYLNESFHVETSKNLLGLVTKETLNKHWYACCKEFNTKTSCIPFASDIDYVGIYLIISAAEKKTYRVANYLPKDCEIIAKQTREMSLDERHPRAARILDSSRLAHLGEYSVGCTDCYRSVQVDDVLMISKEAIFYGSSRKLSCINYWLVAQTLKDYQAEVSPEVLEQTIGFLVRHLCCYLGDYSKIDPVGGSRNCTGVLSYLEDNKMCEGILRRCLRQTTKKWQEFSEVMLLLPS